MVRQLDEYTVQITKLEDNLLFKLANSQGDILEDIELIENLGDEANRRRDCRKSRAGDGDADGDQQTRGVPPVARAAR